jgi:hypothetical protein
MFCAIVRSLIAILVYCSIISLPNFSLIAFHTLISHIVLGLSLFRFSGDIYSISCFAYFRPFFARIYIRLVVSFLCYPLSNGYDSISIYYSIFPFLIFSFREIFIDCRTASISVTSNALSVNFHVFQPYSMITMVS